MSTATAAFMQAAWAWPCFGFKGKPKGKADAGWSSVGAWVFVGTAATKEIIY